MLAADLLASGTVIVAIDEFPGPGVVDAVTVTVYSLAGSRLASTMMLVLLVVILTIISVSGVGPLTV